MVESPEERYTMEDLSAKFEISVSALKSCFKGVYGEAIYTCMKNYRLDLAASMLTGSELSVTEIAGLTVQRENHGIRYMCLRKCSGGTCSLYLRV